MNRNAAGAVATGLALVAGAWMLSTGGGAKIKAQMSFAASSGEPEPTSGGGMKTGMSPDSYGSPCKNVIGALTGPHPLKSHPKTCSPGMSAVMARKYDWMFCPPSEDDL